MGDQFFQSRRFVKAAPTEEKRLLHEDKVAVGASSEPSHRGVFPKVSAAERAQLQQWARQRTSPYRLVIRSRIVLLASKGLTVAAIAARVKVAAATVRLWKRRFAQGGLPALTSDAPRQGRPTGISRHVVTAVLEATRHHAPSRRTVRRVAREAGTSPSSVWRVWQRFALGPDSSSASVNAVIEKVLSETGGGDG